MPTATREFQVLSKPIGAVCNLDWVFAVAPHHLLAALAKPGWLKRALSLS